MPAARSVSLGETPARVHSSATHRYIEPVSKKCRPKSFATLFAIVVFPAPAGPSIAITSSDNANAPKIVFEIGIAGGDHFRILDHRCTLGDHSSDCESHPDPVITRGSYFSALKLYRAVNLQPVCQH